MKKLFYLLVVGFTLVPLSALALITGSASTDIIGNVNYTFSDGTSGYSYKDSIGYTRYQFSDGIYGSAYTDSAGATHYYFDEIGKNKYVNGSCVFPSGYTCTEQSQYDEMYKKAEAGLPKTDYVSEKGGFAVPQTLLTPEGREQAIMSGSYGSWLKMCKEHVASYTSAKASYDSCVQKQNEQYEKIAQMKLNILKQQLDNERQRLEIEKIKLETKKLEDSIKQVDDSNDVGSCNSGLVWDGKSCVTCDVFMPHSSAQNYGSITACTCNDGFHYDLPSQSCLTATEWLKNDQKPNTPFQFLAVEQEKKKILENQGLENEKKVIETKTTKVDPTKTIFPAKNKEIKNSVILGINSTTTDFVNPVFQKVTEDKINEPAKKIGVFQKAGGKVDGVARGVSDFFRKIFIKIKFW